MRRIMTLAALAVLLLTWPASGLAGGEMAWKDFVGAQPGAAPSQSAVWTGPHAVDYVAVDSSYAYLALVGRSVGVRGSNYSTGSPLSNISSAAKTSGIAIWLYEDSSGVYIIMMR